MRDNAVYPDFLSLEAHEMTDDNPAKRKPLAERRELAFKMRKAGRSAGSVAKQLGFRNAQAVDEIVAKKLEEDRASSEAFAYSELELARLDDLQESLTTQRLNGVPGAEAQLLKLAELRLRVMGARHREPGELYRSVEESVKDLTLTAADAAAKQAVLDMARMIDAAMSMGTTDDQRRAINAMATFRNLLHDLGANPAARDEMDGIVSSASNTRSPQAGDAEEDVEKGDAVLSFMDQARRRFRATS